MLTYAVAKVKNWIVKKKLIVCLQAFGIAGINSRMFHYFLMHPVFLSSRLFSNIVPLEAVYTSSFPFQVEPI
jgi:hypothetical protein